MKIPSLLLCTTLSLFASSIEELSHNTEEINKKRIQHVEVLSMEIDIREARRSHIIEERKSQSAQVSKMIQFKDLNRT